MIYHLLTPNRIHLCPSIISDFSKHFSDEEQVFILPFCSKENRSFYEGLSRDCLCRIIFLEDFRLLSNYVSNKHIALLLHSLNTEWLKELVRFGYDNIHVVNWGHIPSKRNRIISCLKHPYLAYCYWKIKSVVALMEPDYKPLKDFFPQAYVVTISYLGNSNRINQINECLSANQKSNHNCVYVGNNSGCIKEYIFIAENILYRFKDKLKVLYMLNYSLVKNSDYYKLLEINKDYVDSKTDEITHPIDKYVEYMNNCDIYICSRDRQTGLAAIHTCLQLGKKLYLDGPNYEWVKNHLQCIVFHISDIQKMDYHTFIEPLSEDEKKQNKNHVEEFLSDKKIIERWKQYFDFIKHS